MYLPGVMIGAYRFWTVTLSFCKGYETLQYASWAQDYWPVRSILPVAHMVYGPNLMVHLVLKVPEGLAAGGCLWGPIHPQSGSTILDVWMVAHISHDQNSLCKSQ